MLAQIGAMHFFIVKMIDMTCRSGKDNPAFVRRGQNAGSHRIHLVVSLDLLLLKPGKGMYVILQAACIQASSGAPEVCNHSQLLRNDSTGSLYIVFRCGWLEGWTYCRYYAPYPMWAT